MILTDIPMNRFLFKAVLAAAAVAAMFPCHAVAQQGTVPDGDRRFSYSNWYISATGGEQVLYKGSGSGKYFVGKIHGGTWFTTWSGLKVNVQGGLRYLTGGNSVKYYSVGADYTLNLLRLFGGYDESTPFSFSASAGPAVNFLRYPGGDGKYITRPSVNVGFQLGYDFSPHWGIFAEAMSYTMEQFYSPKIAIFTRFDCSIGIRFKFSRHSYGKRNADRQYYDAAIDALEKRVSELEEQIENEREEESDSRIIVTPETEAASVDIYFDEFSSYINEDQRNKIDGIGEWMSDNTDFNVRIVVFSDNVSDKETEKKITLRRSEVLKELLMENYGIEEGRIEVVGSEEVGYRNLTGCNAKIIFLNR